MNFSQIITTPGGIVSASSIGTAVQDSRSGNGNFGAWTQMIASLDFDAYGFNMFVRGAGSSYWNFEIGVGGSGSEVSIGAAACAADTGAGGLVVFVPLFVPAGSRVAVRAKTEAQYNTDSNVALYPIRGQSNGVPNVGRGTLIGVSSGAWSNLDAGATAHTKGAYTQIISSTTVDAKGWSVFFGSLTTQTSINGCLVDLAVGAAASEVVIHPDQVVFQQSYALRAYPFVIGPFWNRIPAGSRIAARMQCASSTSAERQLKVAMILWE